MSLIAIFALAVGLGMDAFAVAITVGMVLPRLSFRPIFRLSWHFGLFQFLMPMAGWLAGMTVHEWVGAFDHWIALGLLVLVGGKMIYESFRTRTFEERGDPTRGWTLVVLSVATSIDALAVGLSMAMLNVKVWFPGLIIGIVAGVMTFTGMQLGRQLGKRFGSRIEMAGGLILIGIGVKILLDHFAV